MVIFGDPIGVHDSFDSEEAEGLAKVFSFNRRSILTRHLTKTNSLACCGRRNQVLQRGVLRHLLRGFAGRSDEYLADIFIATEKLGLPSEPMTVK